MARCENTKIDNWLLDMKRKLNLSKPATLMYYCAKSMGLVPFTLKNNTFCQPGLMDRLYMVIVAVINLLLVMKRLGELLGIEERINVEGPISLAPKFLFVIVYAIPSSVTPMAFLLMHKEMVDLMSELCNVGKELKNSGLKVDHEKIIRHGFAAIVTANVINVLILVGLGFYQHLPFHHLIYQSLRSFSNLNTIVIFSCVLFHIKQCFTLVNKKLNDTFEPEIHDRSAVFVVSEENRENSESLTDLQCLWKIEALHLKLCELLSETTRLFALPMILHSFRMLCELVVLSYGIYRNIANLTPLSFILLLNNMLLIFQIILITHASETTCRKGNETKIVLLRMWNKIKSVKVDEEFFMFSLQLLDDQVTVSLFGFLELGYSFIYKLLCAVVTYFIIMVQLDKSKPEHGA